MMNTFVADGRLESWFFCQNPGSGKDALVKVGIFCTPHDRSYEISSMKAEEILPGLGKVISKAQAFETSVPADWSWKADDRYEARVGTGEGVSLHRCFRVLDSQLVLDIFGQLGNCVVDKRMDQAALIGIFFFLKAFNFQKDSISDWASRWIETASRKICGSTALAEEVEQLASRLVDQTPGLHSQLASSADGQYGEWQSLFEKHRENFKWLGERFHSGSIQFTSQRPPFFAVFHSFIHDHFLRLGYGTNRELTLTALIATFARLNKKAS